MLRTIWQTSRFERTEADTKRRARKKAERFSDSCQVLDPLRHLFENQKTGRLLILHIESETGEPCVSIATSQISDLIQFLYDVFREFLRNGRND